MMNDQNGDNFVAFLKERIYFWKDFIHTPFYFILLELVAA